MLEIINDVLAAEKRAEQTIEQARKEAAELRSKIAEEESKRVREAQRAADARLRDAISAAREEQDRRVAEAEAEFRDSTARVGENEQEQIASAVDQIVKLLTEWSPDRTRENA